MGEGEEGMLCEGGTLFKKGTSPTPPPPRETLIYSVWRRCFTFFETVEDGRVHSCLKKDRALPNEITARFQEALNQCLPEAFRIENEMFSM